MNYQYYDAKTMISAPLCFYNCSSKQKHRLIKLMLIAVMVIIALNSAFYSLYN